ncbi:hypothetical protein MJD09_11420 [bacterium]|nr:hypothetical protein [bacterium]
MLLMGLDCPPAWGQALPGRGDTSYEQGMDSWVKGDLEAALKTWQSAREVLDRDGRADPRIGFAFIELTAEQQLKELYGVASAMYYWGLSDKSWDNHQKSIFEEVERVIPLLTEEESKRWRALLKAADPSIISELRQFWIELDPILSTTVNERLIEHWQRIAYSRKKFKKGSSSV